MRRIAILSDIHGNLEALQAVMQHLAGQGADEIISLGDIIGYGPDPEECSEIIRQSASIIVMGNHEYRLINGWERKDRMNPLAALVDKALSRENKEFIASLPLTAIHAQADLCFSHSSFIFPADFPYIDYVADAQKELNYAPKRICFIGHTHQPKVYGRDGMGFVLLHPPYDLSEGRFFINVGSVGQPRDKDNRACYGLLEIDGSKISFRLHRIKYDYSATGRKIEEAGLPLFFAERLKYGH
jgi:predicted phosphodiesterase